MRDSDRFQLRFGPYRTPRYRKGQVVICSARGQVTIVGTSDGKMPWPVGKTHRAKSLVLYKDLERAVRRESVLAIQYWWGVGPMAVRRWRTALGIVGTNNEGTSALRRDHFAEPWAEIARRKAWSKARDPVRCEKIAASKRGKPRPPHVLEAMRKASVGRVVSQETRRKMSEAHRKPRQT
ncbi:MAG TPA: NUMOD3 domain-containing DNA-binding protein [Gemmatales bacterium]|nr:NUMOD3 domain-containing DNA-binding protein [Gemmatales bacterium]